jgi:hypothetical protein
MKSSSVNSTNGNAVDRVGVSIEVAVVALTGTITTGKNVDGTKTTTSLLNRLEHSSSNHYIGRLHGLAIIRRTP